MFSVATGVAKLDHERDVAKNCAIGSHSAAGSPSDRATLEVLWQSDYRLVSSRPHPILLFHLYKGPNVIPGEAAHDRDPAHT